MNILRNILPTRAQSPKSRSWQKRRGSRQRRQKKPSSEKARFKGSVCRENSPIVRKRILLNLNSILLKVILPAARQSRGETGNFRLYSRCAVKCSTLSAHVLIDYRIC